jgi:16S rRNA (uracil1498-N3)-methyltransferase
MHRFFIEPTGPTSVGMTLMLPDNLAHQARVVLHLAVGEQLMLFDNSGDELLCAVSKSDKGGVEVEVLDRRAGKSESSIQIVLYQGILKSARFEWILEKGTELGVSTFAPVTSERTQSGLEGAGAAKQQRWQRIIQEATEQCGRARRPNLLPIRSLGQALNDLPVGALALMPWEEEQGLSLRAALRSLSLKDNTASNGTLTVALFIGPEGGLTPAEVAQARDRGVHIVTLGPRILRAETAALATVANVMYALEGRILGA